VSRRIAALLLLVLANGCAAAGSTYPPPAREPLPRTSTELARKLTDVHAALRRSIDDWRAGGGLSRGQPPRDVALGVLYEQRAYRFLSKRPRLAARVLARLRRPLAPTARDLTTALRDLVRLAPPPRRRKYKTGAALPAGVLLAHYRRAERRFGVSWRLLAAVNLVESDFNRLQNDSVSGARGPMQFLPATWRRYGMGGDVRDPHDAILGAANYLRASGAPGSYRRALFAYNPAPLYVDAVLRLARRMSGRGFLALYNWQVFVRMPAGERRLTGPR
jgi:membrane-bound lytic murein transglycosylase B